MSYYWEFFERSIPLYTSHQLSDEEHNNESCQVFHPVDREILTNRLFLKNPNHPSDKAYDFKDIFDAALTYFLNVRLHRHQQCCLHDNDNLKLSDTDSHSYRCDREEHNLDCDCDCDWGDDRNSDSGSQ